MPNGMALLIEGGAYGRSRHEKTSAFIKVTPQNSPVPRNQVRIQQEVCNPEQGPHLTLLALWSEMPSLQDCEQ